MNIQQLADLFHLNKQTIRFYRDQKLLKPIQGENRYFYYGTDELAALFQILNLRQTNHSLQDIREYMSDGQERLQDNLRREEQHLAQVEEQLAELELIHSELERRIRYRRSILETPGDIWLGEASGLYYLTLDQFQTFPEEISVLVSTSASYQSLVIDLNQFLDSTREFYCPQYALGVTQPNARHRKEYQACHFSRYHVIEEGHTALRTILRLSQLNQLDASLFQPVKDYAKQHHLRFAAPVTSIILMAMCEPANAYYVLFRFIVEKEP